MRRSQNERRSAWNKWCSTSRARSLELGKDWVRQPRRSGGRLHQSLKGKRGWLVQPRLAVWTTTSARHQASRWDSIIGTGNLPKEIEHTAQANTHVAAHFPQRVALGCGRHTLKKTHCYLTSTAKLVPNVFCDVLTKLE